MKGRDHAFQAMAALSLLLFFNCVFLIIYLESAINLKLDNGIVVLGIVCLLIFTTNYFILSIGSSIKRLKKGLKMKQIFKRISVQFFY